MSNNNNNNKQPLDLTESLPVSDKAQAPSTTSPTINKLDYAGINLVKMSSVKPREKNDSLGVPGINQPDVTTRNLSHSDKGSTSAPIIEVNQTPYDVVESDDETIGFLLDCAERGEHRANQRPPYICKVSRMLRDQSKSSYKPQLVSIGPIHREDKKLQKFEWLKECYLNDLLYRCRVPSTPKETLEACLKVVKTLIPQIRESYAGVKKNYSEVELARMMVMDGCFILEFCFKHDEGNWHLPNEMLTNRIAMDLILLENQVPFFVLQDLFECLAPYISKGKRSLTLSQVLNYNLVPYIKVFISQLPEEIPTTDVDSDSTHDHILGYLHRRYRLVAAESSKPKHAEASNLVDEEQAKSSNPKHVEASKKPRFFLNAPGPRKLCSSFCKIFHKCTWSNSAVALSLHAEASKKPRFFLNAPSPRKLCSSFCKNFRKCTWSNCVVALSLNAEASKHVDEGRIAFHSIVELDRSGMNFKPHQEDDWSMTINFQSSLFACLPWFCSKPTLIMPTLFIHDSTELLLRNFVAYEQLFPQDHCYFTSYSFAMNTLIDTQEDIAKLVESKVLVNILGSNQEAADMINKIGKNIWLKDFYYIKVFKQMDAYYNGFWPKHIARLRRVYFSNPWSIIALLAAFILFSLTLVQTIFTIKAA